MTNNGKMDHRAIFDMACFLKPLYNVQQDRYMAYLKLKDASDNAPREETKVAYEAMAEARVEWHKSVEAYHQVLVKNASALGKATRLGAAGVKLVMGVRGTMILWTPEWLRNVANYERINPNYWVHPEARKLNHYEFPKEICS
jgi:hypothetical protein